MVMMQFSIFFTFYVTIKYQESALIYLQECLVH